MRDPFGGYWQIGNLVFFNFAKVDRKVIGQHLLGWLIKGFFLPLMFIYFCKDLHGWIHLDFSKIVSFKHFFDAFYDKIFLIDVGVVSMGCLLSLKLFDTPVAYVMWGSCILVLFSIYVWASVMFGCRVSNLTHRGILTNGPYRYSKHPAYISKNLGWWMTSVPFLAQEGFKVALSKSLLLLAFNVVYFLRAKTEEANLSSDPVYVQYAEWIETNGIFAWISDFPAFKFLRYKKPGTQTPAFQKP